MKREAVHAACTLALVGGAFVAKAVAGDDAAIWYAVGGLVGVLTMIAESIAVFRS